MPPPPEVKPREVGAGAGADSIVGYSLPPTSAGASTTSTTDACAGSGAVCVGTLSSPAKASSGGAAPSSACSLLVSLEFSPDCPLVSGKGSFCGSSSCAAAAADESVCSSCEESVPPEVKPREVESGTVDSSETAGACSAVSTSRGTPRGLTRGRALGERFLFNLHYRAVCRRIHIHARQECDKLIARDAHVFKAQFLRMDILRDEFLGRNLLRHERELPSDIFNLRGERFHGRREERNEFVEVNPPPVFRSYFLRRFFSD